MTVRNVRFRAAFIGGALLLSSALAGPAAAQDSGFMDAIMTGLGLQGENSAPPIEYRERAPLVVPGSAGVLPPPQDPNALVGSAAWPKDPDEEARKNKSKEVTTPFVAQTDKADGKALRPGEIAGKRKAGAGNTYDAGKGEDPDRRPMKASELGFTGWLNGTKKDTKMVFSGEPERESLTQPPVGYQTPATNAPYGVVEEKKKTWKMPTLFDRTTPNDRN